MTWFANFRLRDEAGGVRDPGFLQRTNSANPSQALLGLDDPDRFESEVTNKHVLFVSHGFNVNQADGVRSAMRMEIDLKSPTAPFPLRDNSLFVGILWPGDSYTVLNYPVEAFDAVQCGGALARLINARCANAASVSFASHSLGARVILSAAGQVQRGLVDKIILTAPAADNDCLVRQHSAGFKAAKQMFVLSSKRDNTLKYLYPVGDLISDVIGDDDSPFRAALGYRGPVPAKLNGMLPRGIAGKPYGGVNQLKSDFDHCHYFPPANGNAAMSTKTRSVSHYISAAFAGHDIW